jgi:hypothetical protein
MVRDIPSFVFRYKFYLVINKIKAKFVIGESKYVWILHNYMNLNPKCNSYIQIHFKITHRWLKATWNVIPTCKVTLKYPICSLGGPLNEDQGLDAIHATNSYWNNR